MKDQPRPKRGKSVLKIIFAGQTTEDGPLTAAERAYFKELNRIVDAIYERADSAFHWTWHKLAIEAELTYPTVCKLGNRETKRPQFLTVYKLAAAVGWTLTTMQHPTKKTQVPVVKAA